MPKYKNGDRVAIIRGKYATNRFCTYLRPYGKVMACIKVDGDGEQARNVLLTSLGRIVVDGSDTNSSTTEPTDGTVVLTREDYNSMVNEIDSLSDKLHKLKLRMEECNTDH